MGTFIDWKPVDPQNPPQPTEETTSFLFLFNGKVFDGWPLHDAESGLDMRDGDGYPVWEIAEGSQVKKAGVRWYSETHNQPPAAHCTADGTSAVPPQPPAPDAHPSLGAIVEAVRPYPAKIQWHLGDWHGAP